MALTTMRNATNSVQVPVLPPASRAQSGGFRVKLLDYLSLFTSFGTLLCCALPSLLVLLGLGATVASVLSEAPWLVWLDRHREWTFMISGVLIAGDWLYTYWLAPRLRAQNLAAEACPVDGPSACEAASRFSRITLWIATVIYAIGFFTAYILGPLLFRYGP